MANGEHIETRHQPDRPEEEAGLESPTETRVVANEGHIEPHPQQEQLEEIADIQSLIEPRSVANEGYIEPRPQSDEAKEVAGSTESRTMANEGNVEFMPQSDQGQAEEVAGLTEPQTVADGAQVEPNPQSDQAVEVTDIQDSVRTRSATNEGQVDDEHVLLEADQSCYHAIIAGILWLRVLDQQRAAQKECSSKISILHRLMNLKQPSMVSAPIDDEYQDSREKLRSDFERYERNPETRCAQAETAKRDIPHLLESSKARMDRFDDFFRTPSTSPDVACLRNSAEFQAIFERCRFYFRNLSDIEDEISDEEREMDLAHGNIDAYASRLATRGLELAGLTAAREPTILAAELRNSEYSPAQELQENISTRLSRLQELKAELQKTEQTYFEHKEKLAKIAEKLLIEAGMLEPGAPHVENHAPAPNTGDLPDVVGAVDGNHGRECRRSSK